MVDIESILIGVFISVFILFIIVWSIGILKWRQRYNKIVCPCLMCCPSKKKKLKHQDQETIIKNVGEKSKNKYQVSSTTGGGVNNNNIVVSNISSGISGVNNNNNNNNKKTTFDNAAFDHDTEVKIVKF